MKCSTSTHKVTSLQLGQLRPSRVILFHILICFPNIIINILFSGDVYEIHRLFLQYWSDSTKVIRDFTLGYSSLTSAKEINKSVRNNQNRRKSLHTPGSKDTGCSYE